ncbi:MAG TPA: glycerate kinase [Thiobacillaceae bacterium]|nr:glycerate kinase [Thiobacillaceae bacterium]
MTARTLLLESFHAALAAADATRVLPPHLPRPPRGRTVAVGGGKAAASMAAAVEAHWPNDAPLTGLVVTRYGHTRPTRRIEVVEAGHPLPDEHGQAAALRMLDLARGLGTDDLLLALISGGGSSLLAAPVEGVGLAELRGVTQALLNAGAAIHDINVVRKHLTRVSGGRLACAAGRATGLALIVSDVVGDNPADIASGPCAPDPSTCRDALERLHRFRIEVPANVRLHLEGCAAADADDTPKPGDPCFARIENRVIASAEGSLEAAAGYFRMRGIEALVLSDRVSASARDSARQHAALVRALNTRRPLALLSGGETTVALEQSVHLGGRNTEFLLALALALDGAKAWAIAVDSDGIDGSQDAAGAILTPSTLARAQARGMDATLSLAKHDSHRFFAALDDLVVTGPTLTNVNDYRAILLGVA